MTATHPAPEEALRAFAARVRERRTSLGLTQGAFARREGFNRTYISSVERGRRNVSLVNLLRLARALEVDPAELLDGLPPPRDEPATARHS